jgi:branched-chain amino acid transport system substrate-binding protein
MCSVFVDGFFAESSRNGTKKFIKAYSKDYKDLQPTLLDATGYDAAAMLRHVIEKGAPKSRGELASQLALLKDFEGASGKTSFNDKREAVKQLYFLTIDKDGIKEINPSKKPSG